MIQLRYGGAAALKNKKQADVATMKEMLNELKLHIEALFDKRDADRKDVDIA
jgi:hypothetical protein